MYATATELASALRRTFTPEEISWVEDRIEEATEFMREYMGGVHIAPVATTTYTATPTSGEVALTQPYVRSIDAVTYEGSPIAYTRHQDTIRVANYRATELEITYTHGLDKVPADLRRICVGLVAAQLDQFENDMGLSVGGLSSIALDDFKVAFADGGDKTGLYLSEHHIAYLQRKYGRTMWVMEGRK